MSKKFLLLTFVLGVFLLLSGSVQAVSTLTAAQTVANSAVGTADQTATLVTSPANLVGVKASTTVTVVTAPADHETLVVGGCTITFHADASTTLPLTCAAGTAAIGVGDGSNATTTAGLAATIIGSLGTNFPNVTASGTMLTISASSTNTSAITFTAATSSALGAGKILVTPDGAKILVTSTTHSFAGTASVAQIDTITIAGTVDSGDVFLANLPTAGLVGYTVLPADTTTTLIAKGLGNAIYTSPGYDAQAFTVSTSTNTVILTAKAAGTGFTVTSSALNYAGVAQQITFTPADVTFRDTFRIEINGRTYSYFAEGDVTVAKVVAGLVLAAAADSDATCSNTGSAYVTCVAKVAGTAFNSYSATVTDGGASSASSNGPSGGSPNLTITNLTLPPTASPVALKVALTRAWAYGKTSNEIKALQKFLNSHGFLVAKKGAGSPGKETTYFGQATKAALIKFQRANKISPYNGALNTKTRALLNSL